MDLEIEILSLKDAIRKLKMKNSANNKEKGRLKVALNRATLRANTFKELFEDLKQRNLLSTEAETALNVKFLLFSLQ